MTESDRWFGTPTLRPLQEMAVAALTLVVAFLPVFYAVYLADSPKPNPTPWWVKGLLGLLFFAMWVGPMGYLAIYFFRDAIELWSAYRPTETGLLVRGLWGRRTLPWERIVGLVGSRKIGYRLHLSDPSVALLLHRDTVDLERLAETILERAPALEEFELGPEPDCPVHLDGQPVLDEVLSRADRDFAPEGYRILRDVLQDRTG